MNSSLGQPSCENFPRIYRISKGWKIANIGMGIFFITLATAGLVFAADDSLEYSAGNLIIGLMFVGVFALGICALMYALSGKPNLTLYADTVEISSFFTTRRLHRYEIQHYSINSQGYGIYEIVLEPKFPTEKPVKISSIIKRDNVLDEWIESFPNIDRIEAEEANEELEKDPELGDNPKERMARIVRARKVALWLNIFAFAAMGWVVFYPHPYTVAISVMIILPWIAIAMVGIWPHLFRIDAKSDFGRPLLITVFFLPGLILTLRAVFDFNLLDWETPVIIGIFAGLGISIVAAFADRGTPVRIGPILLFLLMMTPYGYGATTAVNRLLDSSTPQYFPAAVQGKHSSSGKGSTYSVTLDSWGPRDGPNSLDVSRQIYDQLGTNMHVCVRAQQGALGIAYFWLEGCPSDFEMSEQQGLIKASAVSLGVTAFRREQYAVARAFLQEPIKDGNAEAQFTLGLIYWQGLGFPKNGKESIRLFMLAAEQGHARALNVLGYSFERGIGIPTDIEKAIHWYREAVKEDEPRALNNLAILYSNGNGVPHDVAEAEQLWRRAVNQGHTPAMHNLASLYFSGNGHPRDTVEAERLWRESANLGDASAAFKLGVMYGNGDGVDADLAQAYAWFHRAASRFHVGKERARAIKARDVLSIRMTPAQIAKALKIAQER